MSKHKVNIYKVSNDKFLYTILTPTSIEIAKHKLNEITSFIEEGIYSECVYPKIVDVQDNPIVPTIY